MKIKALEGYNKVIVQNKFDDFKTHTGLSLEETCSYISGLGIDIEYTKLEALVYNIHDVI